jgi:hypothetical protein
MTKSSAKTTRRKTRHSHRKTAPKNAKTVGKKVAAERVQTQRKFDAAVEPFRSTRLHDTFRGLAERNVARTRELYERSKVSIQAMFESWQTPFGAASQGVLALNRRLIDIADRNINNSFDLATSLVGAKNLAEVAELQAAYWRRQFSEMTTQAEEVRVLSTKVATDVARPIKSQAEAAAAKRNQ